ncbi:MAG TPA: biopolymer transporter ExbD [Prolixibacteraceae bacterium]|nr:biopolymer transporter ExbD [Prolixibacteraceae bacterium]
MPKVKLHRKSAVVDMTAMCDVAFLLLTFFMLTSNFAKKESTVINTPTSISEIKIPERNIIMIMVDDKGRTFFGIDGQENRISLLQKMGIQYDISFTEKELKEFSLIDNFGVPVNQMKSFLSLTHDERETASFEPGIPCDSLNNQLKEWISATRSISKDYRIAIKADQVTAFPYINKVMETLLALNENRFNLITTLENAAELEIKQ